MKISWGHKILFAYLAFVAGIMFLVFKASREKFDLVTPDYYEAELKYQDVIDRSARVAALSAQPKITHSANSINIELPTEFAGKLVQGEVYLYRASDASRDIRKKFITRQGLAELPLDKKPSGSYEVKLSWQAEGKTYYQEQKVFF